MLIKDALVVAPDQQSLIEDFKAYIYGALAIHVRIQDWPEVKRLPLYLGKAFAYKRAQIGGRNLLVVLDQTGQWTPDALIKQLHQIEEMAKLPPVFVTSTISSRARARLVAQKASFVVPGRQLYLPAQGVVFSENYPTRTPTDGHLAFATQAALIHILLRNGQHTYQPGLLAKELQYTPMTITRAFNELESKGLAVGQTTGRNRYLEFKLKGRDLWERAKGFMVNPARKRLWLTHGKEIQGKIGYKAGLSALSERSELAAPDHPVFAVPPAGWDWPGIQAHGNDVLHYSQQDAIEVECWAYPPRLFAKGRVVDPLNLYLTLRDDPDQRIQSALEDLEATLW